MSPRRPRTWRRRRDTGGLKPQRAPLGDENPAAAEARALVVQATELADCDEGTEGLETDLRRRTSGRARRQKILWRSSNGRRQSPTAVDVGPRLPSIGFLWPHLGTTASGGLGEG